MKKIALILCTLLLLVLVVGLLGCGSSGGETSSTKTPEQVAKAFWTAAMKSDADTSYNLLSKTMREGLKDKATWASSLVGSPTATIEVGKATIDGDSATVTVKILSNGKLATTSKTSLVKEDGAWKVSLP